MSISIFFMKHLSETLGILLLGVCKWICGAVVQSDEPPDKYAADEMSQSQNDMSLLFLSGNYDNHNEPLLSRQKRDLAWEDVEKFYQDKNNFAMFLVLPIIVLVYGGCAVIYCIARCRRYAKRRKRKPKSKEGFGEEEPLENATNIVQPGVTTITNPTGGVTSREGASTSSDVLVGVDENDTGTPLPWQVPGEKQYDYPAKGATAGTVVTAAAVHNHRQPLPSNQYVNNAYEDDLGDPSPRPPPYEESMNYNRPVSKPPPYDGSNKNRRDSVEEIISLDPMPVPNNANDRKRRRSGDFVSSNETKLPPPNKVDEERERARALVRGDKPKRDIQPRDKQPDRDRTPDIISHARTRPLEPRYRPAPEPTDPNAMAKQAAQLLRLDHLGKQQGKKQKRLVFVAE